MEGKPCYGSKDYHAMTPFAAGTSSWVPLCLRETELVTTHCYNPLAIPRFPNHEDRRRPRPPHLGPPRAPLLDVARAVHRRLRAGQGKALGQPVYRLLGGSRTRLPAYATGGYYQEGKGIDDLVKEVGAYVEGWGFKGVKLKVGGVPIPEDVARLKAVRAAFPDLDIMIDANSAYDVQTAVAAARAFEPIGIRWLEEPVHWYDPVFGLGRVSAATSIPTASGESELHRWGCRDLVDHAGIQIVQFDCTRAGGLTEGLKVAAYAASKGVWFAPHHDPQIHGHLVAAIPNGLILEAFPNKERDPLWDELFEEKPEIVDGHLTLSDRPGWGVSLNRKTLERYRA